MYFLLILGTSSTHFDQTILKPFWTVKNQYFKQNEPQFPKYLVGTVINKNKPNSFLGPIPFKSIFDAN